MTPHRAALLLLLLAVYAAACTGLSSSDDFVPTEEDSLASTTTEDTNSADVSEAEQDCQEFCAVFSACDDAILAPDACLTHCTSTSQDTNAQLAHCLIGLAYLMTGDDHDYTDYAEEICELTELQDVSQCDTISAACGYHCGIFEDACAGLGLDTDACASNCIDAHLNASADRFRCNQDALAQALKDIDQKANLCLTALNGCDASQGCILLSNSDPSASAICASQCKPTEPRCEGGLLCQEGETPDDPDYCVGCQGPSCNIQCNPACVAPQNCVNGACKTPCVNNACADGAMCVNGYCEAGPSNCSPTSPCPLNERCISGACYQAPACGAIGDCGVGETCDAGNVCVCGTTQGNLGPACQQTSAVCTADGQCTPYSPIPCGGRPCQPGETCTADQCTCGAAPCAPGQYCSGGQCLN